MTFVIGALLLGVGVSLLLGIHLIFLPRGSAFANRLIGGLVLAIGAELTVYLSHYVDEWRTAPHLIRVFTLAPYLIGPFLLGYVHSMTRRFEPGWSWWLLHLSPAFIGIAYLFPDLLLDAKALHSRFREFPQDNAFRWILLIGKYVSLFAYCGYVLYLLKRHKRRLVHQLANLANRRLRWLFWLVVTIMIAHAVLLLIWATGRELNLDGYFGLSLAFVVFFVHGFAIRQPEVCQGVLNRDKLRVSASDSMVQRCRQGLERLEAGSEFFRDQDITLQILAQQIDVPAHYLSQFLNVELGQNFFLYVNGLRIEHVKRALADPERRSESVLSIAFEAGFSTKSSFNRAFKKSLGLTPTQYRDAFDEAG